jgi:hypothetical protein
VRSIDVHFHDGRARAGADAEKRGENVAAFLGHTDDGKTARRHYLNRGASTTPCQRRGRRRSAPARAARPPGREVPDELNDQAAPPLYPLKDSVSRRNRREIFRDLFHA